MANCPICKTPTTHKYPNTPYWMCPNCDCFYQDPLPPKVFEADHEKGEQGEFRGHLMNDAEKDINMALAGNIFRNFMGSKPGKMLDVGAKYPWFAHCFQTLGYEAFAMDNIEIVPEYSKALNVPMLMADFEALTDEQIRDWTKTEKFQLITMVHMFEHLYDPLAGLRKMKQLLADDGFLFLRLPDHGVSGFERDLTPGHFTIHPFFHSLPSLLELLVQGQDLFTVQWTQQTDTAGQRDLILRPIQKKPQVWCGMIVKNEERDLPKCLNTIKDVVDGIVIIDTGSTDKTQEAALAAWDVSRPLLYETYTGASKKDDSGDWKLWDFSGARNQFVHKIDAIPDADYLIWMDADDTLLTPGNLKRAFYLNEYAVFGLMIETDGLKWVHHRMWKTRQGIGFEGRIHEYPNHGGRPGMTLQDTVIHHDAAPTPTGENSNQRNLRILELEMEEEPKPRTAFYLANTHKDAGRFAEAIPVYQKRIDMGMGFRDETLFAYLYKARCERVTGQNAEAEHTLFQALSHGPNWAEFWMELAYMAYSNGQWRKCIGYCYECIECVNEHTELWREINKYTDQPRRLMSFCYESLGDTTQALQWALDAKETIGCPDKEWDERVASLRGQQPAPTGPTVGSAKDLAASFLKKKQPRAIALNRPGAIGDILITLNLIPALKKKFPNHEIHYFCNPGIGNELASMFEAAGVTKWFDYTSLEGKRGDYKQVINLIGYPLHEGYPEKPMRQHLIQYFAKEMGLPEKMTELSLSAPEINREELGLPIDYATLQVKAGWSVYKSIEMKKWEEVVRQCPEITFVQIGAADDPKIPGAIYTHMGKQIKLAIDLIANAKMHVGLDSFPNHVTNYLWKRGRETYKVPAVILWGSTSAQGSGYDHNMNIGVKLHCRPCYKEDPAVSAMSRGPCDNPPEQDYAHPRHACMAGIPVEVIVKAVKDMWGK